MRSLNGLTHTVVVLRDGKRADRLTAVILLDGVPFQPLLHYFRERNFSLASEEVYARAIGLLMDFIVAIGPTHEERAQRPEFFNRFAHALKHGTIQHCDDPSGLWWVARSGSTAKQLLAATLEVSDWLVEHYNAAPLNAFRKARFAEKIIFWRRWNRASANSLLLHVKSKRTIHLEPVIARRVSSPIIAPSSDGDPPPAFPEELFPRLLQEGFVRPGSSASAEIHRRQNIRDMMIAVLMHGGGLRVSEPFHLFVPDIVAHPDDIDLAFVRIFHPTDGTIEIHGNGSGPSTVTRENYLRSFHNKLPLTQCGKRTGWKNNFLQGNGEFMPVYWFPTHYGKLFMSLYKLYIGECRPNSTDPRLFLTESGLPMTAKAFTQQYYAATARAGIRSRKADGTTPHGHRHAYGQRLELAKRHQLISEKTVQLCLHHRSVMSQRVYTEPALLEVSATLNQASKAMFSEDRLLVTPMFN